MVSDELLLQKWVNSPHSLLAAVPLADGHTQDISLFAWLYVALTMVVVVIIIMAWIKGRASEQSQEQPNELARYESSKKLLQISLAILILELVGVPFVIMTIPYPSMTLAIGLFLVICLISTITAMVMLSISINRSPSQISRFSPYTLTILTIAMVCMMLAGQSKSVATTPTTSSHPANTALSGRALYIANCQACHGDIAQAPSLKEIQSIYVNNPDGIVAWASHPGRKRANYGAMPSMRYLHAQKLKLIAEYMLNPDGATLPQ